MVALKRLLSLAVVMSLLALADCQRERTRNADAAARAIDELAANRV